MSRTLVKFAIEGRRERGTGVPARHYRVRLRRAALAIMLLASSALTRAADERLESFGPPTVVELKTTLPHVQGIETDGESFWVTSVERKADKGFLHRFNAATGEEFKHVEVQRGDMIHPGGLCADGESLWLPVAQYTRKGMSVIERRGKASLELIASFEFADHIGCVAADAERLVGGNWDARQLYIWDKSGKLLRKLDNPSPNHFQDVKFDGPLLVGSGGLDRATGAIEWLDLGSLEIKRRILGGKTDRGTSYMHEGMALREGKLVLLPEDGKSRVFSFGLSKIP